MNLTTRRHFLTSAAVLLAGSAFPQALFAQAREAGGRTVQLFNFDWRFQAGDPPGAEAVGFDAAGWRALHLPHDFQIEQPWDRAAGGARGYKALGVGWYRKAFKADPAWKGKKVLLDFEGVMLFGEVWLNGQKVAEMDYGYLGYEADITKHLNHDGDNIVAVRATTGEGRQSRWYTGGGLFRDVHLVVKNPVSIARHGVFVTTPRITAQSAEVAVQVELEGVTGQRLDIDIHAVIFGPDGKKVAETRAPAPKGIKLATVEVPLPAATLPAPRLWSCETPNLYTAEVTLRRDGAVIDQITETFGIRTLEFSKDFGLKLNGEKVFLKGVADHHDLGALGAAVYDRAIERLFLQLKAFGFNHVRTSHNPYSKSFMRLADKHGILIVDELADKWSDGQYWPGKKPFTQLWYKIVPEWIKRDRNHPSVILWSLGNELQMREDLTGFPAGDWGVTSYKILDLLAKRYDPTRKTTVAMYPSRANAVTRQEPEFNTAVIPPELSLVTEVASFNYQYTAYPEYLKQAPDLIIYQSEAATLTLTASYYGMDRENMVGLAYWGGVEYWGESNGWPKKGWNFSFFNHALEPYPQAWLIKSAFSDAPLVHIAVIDSEGESQQWNDIQVGRAAVSDHWNRAEDSTHNLFTYTNAQEVELLVNGKSFGVQQNVLNDPERRNIISWKGVPYGRGGNLTAVARTAGEEVARHRLETTGAPKALRMEVEGADWKAGGMDLQYVKVYAIDAEGRIVATAKNEVVFDVAGPAGLIAVDNGDHATNETFAGDRRAMHGGFVMAVLRSGPGAGPVKVRASSQGLRAAQQTIVTRLP